MPFTVSHGAAVLPFRRSRLPWAALLIGSFAPDFEYFLRLDYHSRAWHYFPDVLIFCFPASVLAFCLFQAVIKRPTLRLLPLGIQARVRMQEAFPMGSREIALVLVALGLGIATHIAWDSVTHPMSWAWAHLGFLREPNVSEERLYGYRRFGFQFLQDLSSLIGLLVMAVFGVRWYRRTEPRSEGGPPLRGNWESPIAIAMLVIAVVAGMLRAHGAEHGRDMLFVIGTISCLLCELFLYGLISTLATANTPSEG